MWNPFQKRSKPNPNSVMIKEFEFKSGRSTMVAKHPAFVEFAAEMAKFFVDCGGENFVTIEMFHEDIGQFEITIQRAEGKSTTQTLIELRQRIRELEALQ